MEEEEVLLFVGVGVCNYVVEVSIQMSSGRVMFTNSLPLGFSWIFFWR